MQQQLKPSWKGLKGGGGTPVAEVVGLCTGWSTDVNPFGGTNVLMRLANCQVIKSDSPYPYSDWTLQVKWSESQNSAWGKLGASIAKTLQIDIELLDIDLLTNQWLHLLRHDGYQFGTDRQTGQPMVGTIWELTEVLQPGQQVTPAAAPVAAPQYPLASPAQVASPDGGSAAMAQAPLAAPVVQAATISPQAPILPQETAGGGVTATDPYARAKQLLKGKDVASFLQAALPDAVIRGDPMLIQSILTNAFIPALASKGEATLQPDGTYDVTLP